MDYKRKTIQQYSKKPISHGIAISKIASMTGLTPFIVQTYVLSFFGKYGLKYFILKKMKIKINGLGTFYFHSKTVKSYNDKHKIKP